MYGISFIISIIGMIRRVDMNKERRKRNVMLAHPYSLRRLMGYKTPYIIQPKLDGIRCLAHITPRGITLRSSTGLEIRSVPHINRVLKMLSDEDVDIVLDGELYKHGMSFEEISSAVNRNTPIKESFEIQFHIFDCILDATQIERLDIIEWLIAPNGDVRKVPSYNARDEEEIMSILDEIMRMGYEGIIIRNPAGVYERKRSGDIMKLKPRRRDIYTIIGYEEEYDKHGDPKGTLGAFVCSSGEEAFKVGTGFTREQRIKYWRRKERMLGKKIVVKYQDKTKNNIPRFPVLVEVLE